jgi:hypothetical protein
VKILDIFAVVCLMAVFLSGAQQSPPPIPQTFPPPEQTNPPLPIDQPPVVVHGSHRQPFQAKRAEKQAKELARLAQSVPPDINKVAQGQLPKDLLSRLKRIEKLSKQLRGEVGR